MAITVGWKKVTNITPPTTTCRVMSGLTERFFNPAHLAAEIVVQRIPWCTKNATLPWHLCRAQQGQMWYKSRLCIMDPEKSWVIHLSLNLNLGEFRSWLFKNSKTTLLDLTLGRWIFVFKSFKSSAGHQGCPASGLSGQGRQKTPGIPWISFSVFQNRN